MDRAEIIEHKPIGAGLDAFRDDLAAVCESSGLPCSIESIPKLGSEAWQNLALDLILALQALPASRLLPSISGRKNFFSDLSLLGSSINSDDFDLPRVIPLFSVILSQEPDAAIWNKVYDAAAESTPLRSHRRISSKRRTHAVLKEELGSIYTDVPGFSEAYFGAVDDLEEVAAAVFDELKGSADVSYDDTTGWHGWPELAEEKQVLDWLIAIAGQIKRIATEKNFLTEDCRRILGWPHRPLQGSKAPRKLDVGFVQSCEPASKQIHWSNVLILGELKRNPSLDTALQTWLDLGRYARKVFTAQDTRRFVLGFTLCGPIMRLWEFDRVGAVSSTPFNINKEGARFVLSMLGFLRINLAGLGYDPSIATTTGGVRFLEIARDGQPERLILDGLMRGPSCIVGRATTCWKAHREGDQTALVIKDSWQYPEREDEGALIREATEKQVVNVARHYYHGTVQIDGKDDDVRGAVRRGLDLTQGRRYPQDRCSTAAEGRADSARTGRSTSSAGRKRTSSHLQLRWPSSKRTCSSSSAREHDREENRVHRRVIVQDYGVPIYKARSCLSLLSTFRECIEGYESLHLQAGLLQGDISIGNLIINEEANDNSSWPAFLIDLDLVIREHRTLASGAKGRTGTRAFMAIGLLLGEKHSFMHDLESFFWVLLWICIHQNGPDSSRVVEQFESWNYMNIGDLATLKKGTINHEADFLSMTREYFTAFYTPLIPWVNRLRKIVFPNGSRWETEDPGLYARMTTLLETACADPKVLALVD